MIEEKLTTARFSPAELNPQLRDLVSKLLNMDSAAFFTTINVAVDDTPIAGVAELDLFETGVLAISFICHPYYAFTLSENIEGHVYALEAVEGPDVSYEEALMIKELNELLIAIGLNVLQYPYDVEWGS